MFGLEETILSVLPHYYVDFREKLSNDPDIRWTDRIHPDGNWVANLYQFHRRVYMKRRSRFLFHSSSKALTGLMTLPLTKL